MAVSFYALLLTKGFEKGLEGRLGPVLNELQSMTKRLFSFSNPTDQLTCRIKDTTLKQVDIMIRHVYLSINLLNRNNTLSERPAFKSTKKSGQI